MVRVKDLLWISIDAPWHGDTPPLDPVGPTWELWNHEVVEVFIAGPDERYLEIEFGPHGHHLVLQLDGVRNVIARELPFTYSVEREGERWRGEAMIHWELLPEEPHRMNAHAIHGAPEKRTHASLHPSLGDAPDFHRLEEMQPIGWEGMS
jgi:hypothetical protein